MIMSEDRSTRVRYPRSSIRPTSRARIQPSAVMVSAVRSGAPVVSGHAEGGAYPHLTHVTDGNWGPVLAGHRHFRVDRRVAAGPEQAGVAVVIGVQHGDGQRRLGLPVVLHQPVAPQAEHLL